MSEDSRNKPATGGWQKMITTKEVCLVKEVYESRVKGNTM